MSEAVMSHDWIDALWRYLRPGDMAPAVIDISAYQLLLKPLTGWLDRQERDVLRYLLEENRVLRLQPRGRRLQLTDGNRRPRAVRPYRFAAMPDNGVAVEQHSGSKPDAHLWYKLSVAKMVECFCESASLDVGSDWGGRAFGEENCSEG